jgi:hypothetical protein
LEELRRGKKEQLLTKETEETVITDLDSICGSDRNLCKTLGQMMFLDPRKIGTTAKDAAKKAAKYEKQKDRELARIWYHIAGGLVLWNGDTKKVKEYFSKCAELAPEMNYKAIIEIAEKAVEKAGEYYKKHLK